jgi:hypothetical protein
MYASSGVYACTVTEMPVCWVKPAAICCSAFTCDCLKVQITSDGVVLSPEPPLHAAVVVRISVARTAIDGRHARFRSLITEAGPPQWE